MEERQRERQGERMRESNKGKEIMPPEFGCRQLHIGV